MTPATWYPGIPLLGESGGNEHFDVYSSTSYDGSYSALFLLHSFIFTSFDYWFTAIFAVITQYLFFVAPVDFVVAIYYHTALQFSIYFIFFTFLLF